MIELIDLKELRHDCSDLSDLKTLLKPLLGQAFRFFRVSYGEELRLHLGDLQGYSNPKLRARIKGSYNIGARASSWYVYSAPRHGLAASVDVRVRSENTQLVSKQVDVKTIETGGFITPGSIVVSARADRSMHGFSLQLSFSDGSTVYVAPTPEAWEGVPQSETALEDSGGMEISDWEILTPHERILRVGPGSRWNYLDSAKKRSQ